MNEFDSDQSFYIAPEFYEAWFVEEMFGGRRRKKPIKIPLLRKIRENEWQTIRTCLAFVDKEQDIPFGLNHYEAFEWVGKDGFCGVDIQSEGKSLYHGIMEVFARFSECICNADEVLLLVFTQADFNRDISTAVKERIFQRLGSNVDVCVLRGGAPGSGLNSIELLYR